MSAKIGWEFPADTADQWEGFVHPGVENFRLSPLTSLAREVLQNSLDAGVRKPVNVSFRYRDVLVQEIPGVEELKATIQQCLSIADQEGKKAKEFFENAQKLLKGKTVPVLSISEKNTKGMRGPCKNGSPYYSYVKATGHHQGRAYSFSLNLGPTQIAAALRHPEGFTDYFARSTSRALKRALGYVPLYGFAVGIKYGRLHSHGGIEVNDNEEPATRAAIDSVGDWEAPYGRKYKLHWEPMYSPDIWAGYRLRDQAKVKRLIKGRAISINLPLRRRAKEHWTITRFR
jgi:hypothetical protein